MVAKGNVQSRVDFLRYKIFQQDYVLVGIIQKTEMVVPERKEIPGRRWYPVHM